MSRYVWNKNAYYEKKTGTKISSSTITSTRTTPKIIHARKKGQYHCSKAPGYFGKAPEHFDKSSRFFGILIFVILLRSSTNSFIASWLIFATKYNVKIEITKRSSLIVLGSSFSFNEEPRVHLNKIKSSLNLWKIQSQYYNVSS